VKKERHIFNLLPMGLWVGLILFSAEPTWATQTHGDPEGLYVHQFSHAFFLFSMGLLVYWIRTRRLTESGGWRYIQYAAILFMIWTVDAFFAHMMDEYFALVQVIRVDAWHIHINAASRITGVIYYIAKLDHFWCAPAMIFMFVGLRRLNRESALRASTNPGIPEALK